MPVLMEETHTPKMSVVTISYADILNGNDVSDKISSAFGPDGLGICLISDLPDFQEKRFNCLEAIKHFAELPEEVKDRYTSPSSKYSFGWSHGKEVLKAGVPDFSKGSYYANPIVDRVTDDEELKAKHPGVYSDNIWPSEVMPDFEVHFKAIAQVKVQVGLMVAALMDDYLTKLTDGQHELTRFYDMLNDSLNHKARMLHYFPRSEKNKQETKEQDSWNGWHVDFGAVTVLLAPLYHDCNGNQVDAPDDCGLFIKSRNFETVKAEIPENCMAVQLGEIFQYFSGGYLRATPHCVKASSDRYSDSRQQLATFLDPVADLKLELPKFSLSYDEVVESPQNPASYPTMSTRIKDADTFQDFVTNTYIATS